MYGGTVLPCGVGSQRWIMGCGGEPERLPVCLVGSVGVYGGCGVCYDSESVHLADVLRNWCEARHVETLYFFEVISAGGAHCEDLLIVRIAGVCEDRNWFCLGVAAEFVSAGAAGERGEEDERFLGTGEVEHYVARHFAADVVEAVVGEDQVEIVGDVAGHGQPFIVATVASALDGFCAGL